MARTIVGMLALLTLGATTACTDYGYSKALDHGPPGRQRPGTDSGDTGVFVDTDDTRPEETGDTSAPDTGTETDGCWEPEDGYDRNEAARLITTDGTTQAVVTLVSSDTSYQDELWIDAPETALLARAWRDPMGTASLLGPYRTESELVFGIRPLDTGDHWQSGPATRNVDGVVHVAVTYEGDCSWLIGFEDLYGGGDLDYNDVVLRVQGMLRQDE